MGDGDTELAVGGLLGGVYIGEVLLLGVACPLCIVGAGIFMTVGGIRKVKKMVGKSVEVSQDHVD